MRTPTMLILMCLTLTTGLVGSSAKLTAQATSPEKQNVLFVMLDDLDEATYDRAMPAVHKEVEARGTRLDNATFGHSLCCPSRAQIQTGQYAHNNGVWGNEPPDGGFETFDERDEELSTVGTSADRAGYRTIYAGKYMNGYDPRPEVEGSGRKMPGWDYWFAANSGIHPYYSLNGQVRGGRDSTYYQRPFDGVVHDAAYGQIDKALTNDRPFFAFLSFWQPHAPAEYPPFWDDTYANAQLPTGGSFNEADVSDKPAWVQRRDLIGAEEKAALTEHYRNRLRGTRYVDAKIGSIIDLIKSHREYANTYVVFYSDNGFHIGQHRLRTDKFGGPKGTKGTPYIEDVRFPLVVKGPGVRVGAESEAMAQNIDIRPTVEDMVGAATPAGVAGITLLPHLKTGAAFPREYALTEALKPLGSASTWKAVYGPDTAYVEYDGGEREFYDLRKDPHQLENDPLDPRAAEHAEALQRMAGCEGKGCQEAAEGP